MCIFVLYCNIFNLKAPYESKELCKAEEIQHKSQDIYATLRESRESGIAKRNKGIRMKGYLNKKSKAT